MGFMSGLLGIRGVMLSRINGSFRVVCWGGGVPRRSLERKGSRKKRRKDLILVWGFFNIVILRIFNIYYEFNTPSQSFSLPDDYDDYFLIVIRSSVIDWYW